MRMRCAGSFPAAWTCARTEVGRSVLMGEEGGCWFRKGGRSHRPVEGGSAGVSAPARRRRCVVGVWDCCGARAKKSATGAHRHAGWRQGAASRETMECPDSTPSSLSRRASGWPVVPVHHRRLARSTQVSNAHTRPTVAPLLTPRMLHPHPSYPRPRRSSACMLASLKPIAMLPHHRTSKRQQDHCHRRRASGVARAVTSPAPSSCSA